MVSQPASDFPYCFVFCEMKQSFCRDPELAKGWGQIVHPLVVRTPGGPQKEYFADLEGMFRIIQSIPSKKAEPFKRWLAQDGAKRIHQFFEKLVKANPKYCSDSVIDLGWSPRQIVVNYTCRIGVDSLYL